VRVVDANDRPIYLQVAVTPRLGGALRVTVYAPIWIVNKTGLPLVFRQEGSSAEAAGQETEHEVARMAAPLMFSFLEREGNQGRDSPIYKNYS
jgi:vacuolar protein sorting-associated protein 13D